VTVLGVDVSHWQTSTPSLTGLGFVIVKASEGTTSDPKYAMHIANVKAAGKLAGAYHFARDDIDLDRQAAWFATHSPGATFLAVDVEGTHATTTAQTRLLIERIRVHDTLGRQVGLYMSESGFQEAGQDFDWVANWSNTPHHPFLIWQYRGSPLDQDRYEGTLAQLRAALAPIPKAPDSGVEPVTTRATTLTYWKRANAKASRPVRDKGGTVIHTTPTDPTGYPVLAVDETDFVIRLPGEVVGWIAKADVGSISEPGPVPPLPAPDCSEAVAAVQHELDLANSRITAAIIQLGGTP